MSYAPPAARAADLPHRQMPRKRRKAGAPALREICIVVALGMLAGCDESALAPRPGASATARPDGAGGGQPDPSSAQRASRPGGRSGPGSAEPRPTSAVECRSAVAELGKLDLLDRWPASEPAALPLAEGDLPTYEIEQQLDLAEGVIRGRVAIEFPNAASEPLATVPVLLHANAARELGASEASSPWLEVTSAALGARGGSGSHGPSLTTRQPRPTLLEVDLPTPLAPSARARIELRYVAHLRQLGGAPNDMFAQSLGAFGSLGPNAEPQDYGLLAVGDGLLTAALAYPVVAPFREGSFDTGPPTAFGDVAYGPVASFAVHTVLPSGVTAVTNLVDRPIPGPPTEVHTLCSAGRFVRDFVLVAGLDLEHKSVELGPVRVTSVYRARDAKAGQEVLDAAVAALRAFERHFGPYPYAELDVVESSLVGGAGGVEFSALVLVAGMLYRSPDESSHPLALLSKLGGGLGSGLGALLDPGSLFGGPEPEPGASSAPAAPSRSGRALGGLPAETVSPAPPDPAAWLHAQLGQMREFTVAHEVAHQYFAGIVGNDSRRHPSLDEPMAQYAARVAMEDRHGPAVGEATWDANVTMNYALYRLLGGVDRPVARDVASYASAVEYAALVYGKAPQLYPALRRALGQEALHRAIRAALSRHRFSLLTTDEWIDALAQGAGEAGRKVRPLFERWLRQTHADADLGVDDSGKLVLDLAFGPEQARAMRESFAALGIDLRQLFRLAAGGGLEP